MPSSSPKQRKFPARRKLVMSSTSSDIQQRRQRKKDQRTLTQMIHGTSSFEGLDEGSEVEDPDFAQPRPKKRRKMTVQQRLQEMEADQATLTQRGIGWWPHERADEDESTVVDDSTEELEDCYMDEKVPPEEFEEVMQPHEGGHHRIRLADNSCTDRIADTDQVTNADADADADADAQEHDKTLQAGGARGCRYHNASPSPRPRKRPASPSPELGNQPSPMQPSISTPQQKRRTFVPSSESPATTPLSMTTTTPTKRTPLGELHENVWAQRDQESPTPRRSKPVPTLEEADDEKENWSASPEKSEKWSGKASSSSPSKAASSSAPRAYDDDALSMPPPSSRPQRSQPSPLRTLQTLRAEPPHNDHNDHSEHNAIRPSQATTVDVTQRSSQQHFSHASIQHTQLAHSSPPFAEPFNHSPLLSPVNHDNARQRLPSLPPTPPKAFESQFPYSMFSHYSGELGESSREPINSSPVEYMGRGLDGELITVAEYLAMTKEKVETDNNDDDDEYDDDVDGGEEEL